jgi:DNA-binding NarL/FixJ family response regulator
VALRCLIVDDSPGFLEVARTVLEREGMEIVGVASTGSEALQSAADLHPDVTLLDIDLGAESGFVVARWLADDPDLDPGALILISAHAQEDIADLLDASPAVGFLSKPALSATAIERLVRAAGGGHNRPGESLRS